MSNKQARVFVTVQDEEVVELIRATVKNVLRNDQLIQQLIGEEISKEMKLYVNKAMINTDLPKIAESIMDRRIARAIPTSRMVAGSTLAAINKKVTEILTRDENAIAEMLGKEGVKPSCSVCQSEVADENGICSKCQIFLDQA